jgi:GNAT superfamily N-acetyltransferase
MASLYAQYLTERTNDAIIETDDGFATYRFLNPQQCYIVDIFVVPEKRKLGGASRLADQIAEIAKAKGCTSLIGTVVASAKGSTTSLKVLLAYGFVVDSFAADLAVFRKDI